MELILQERLIKLFPQLYVTPERPNGLYFECADGWYDLLLEMSYKINQIIEEDPETYKDFYISQLKEKYGTLRVYTSYSYEPIDHIIEEYEFVSAKTCELCGNPGVLDRDGYWYQTLCDDHRQKRRSKIVGRQELASAQSI